MLGQLLLAAVFAGVRVEGGTCCTHTYWSGQCTACKGEWYQSCRSGYSYNGERDFPAFQNHCPLLCEINCKNSCYAIDDGCGCGNDVGCLACEAQNFSGKGYSAYCP